MVVLRCSSRRRCDRCRGLLYQAQCQPEQSSRAKGHHQSHADRRPQFSEVSRHEAGAVQRIEVYLRRPDRHEPLRRRSQSLPHHGSHRGDFGRHRIDRRRARLASQVRSSLFWYGGARKALCLASIGAPRTGKCPLQHWQRGISRLRQRISRSQLGRRPHADAHAQLVLGACQRRPLHNHRILHYSHRRLRL